MPAIASLIPELEDAVQRGSAEQRAATLARVADLFLAGAGQFNDDHVELFDEVFNRLIVEIESKALAELARRLAPVGNAPINTLRELAGDDDITVAGPVLLRSERLGDSDIIEIARTKGQAHLLAISGRSSIAEAVTDVLVKRGDRDVVRNVATNVGARFSEGGFATLVKRAETDGVLAEKVGRRPDIPAEMFRNLLSQATEVVQKRLLAAAKPETQEEIRRALTKVSRDLDAEAAARPRNFVAAQRAVLALGQAGKLGEPALAAIAAERKYEETVATLSALSGVPIDVVDRLMAGDRPDPVLILSKAMGFGWPTVRAIVQVQPACAKISAKRLDDVAANFERLSTSTAERVVRFWRLRQQVPGAAAAE